MAADIKQVRPAEMSITVDDGSVRVPIKNLYGDEIGVFYFRPTDLGIIDRYNNLAQNFDRVVEPLEKADIAADGTAADPEDEESMAALKEAETRLKEAVDALFDANMSEAFFGHMHPFSPIGGRFYCETAIEAVGSFISRQFDIETEKVASRVEKYTKGVSRKGRKR